MKIRISAFLVRALVLGALLTVSPLSYAAETSGNKTTAKDVSRKVDEAGQAIKDAEEFFGLVSGRIREKYSQMSLLSDIPQLVSR